MQSSKASNGRALVGGSLDGSAVISGKEVGLRVRLELRVSIRQVSGTANDCLRHNVRARGSAAELHNTTRLTNIGLPQSNDDAIVHGSKESVQLYKAKGGLTGFGNGSSAIALEQAQQERGTGTKVLVGGVSRSSGLGAMVGAGNGKGDV
jgi:hypothetical protein